MIRVHHLENSRSQRVLWLLEELGLPYEVVRYARDPKTMLAPPALRTIHPLGKSPVVEADGEVLAESGYILETLAERHGAGRLVPTPGTPAWSRYRYWLHYAEGSAMPPLLLALVFSKVRQAPLLVRPIANAIADKVMSGFVTPQLRTHFEYLEAELSRFEWFAGDDFSAADIMLSFPLEAARSRAGLDARRPALIEWLDRIHARPAYQAALAKGGPYAYA